MKNRLLLLGFLLLSACAAQADPPAQCVRGGCSNERCLEQKPGEGPMAGTCEWTASYGCYAKFGQCERQPDQACGFTPSPALQACLADPAAHGFR